MTMIDDLQRLVQPVVHTVVRELGALASILPIARTEQANGTELETWAEDATRASLPCAVTPISTADAQRLFGLTSDARMTIMFSNRQLPSGARAVPTIASRDAVHILKGPYKNTVWLAEGPGVVDPVSATNVVPLVPAPADVLP